MRIGAHYRGHKVNEVLAIERNCRPVQRLVRRLGFLLQHKRFRKLSREGQAVHDQKSLYDQ